MRGSAGVEFAFSYSQGQSFVVDDSDFLPHFTGHHDQPFGELKLPEIGDPVIFNTQSSQVEAWGYMANFVACAAHRYGTSFVAT